MLFRSLLKKDVCGSRAGSSEQCTGPTQQCIIHLWQVKCKTLGFHPYPNGYYIYQANQTKNKKENSPKDLPTQTRFGGNTSLSLESTPRFLQMSVNSSPSIYPTSKMRNHIPNTLTNVLLLDPNVEA